MFPLDPSGFRARLRAVAGSTPWLGVLRDLVVVVAWVAAASLAFRAFGWPSSLYYVVVFGGVIAYSVATGPRLVADSR